MRTFLLVCTAGALGTAARYLIALAFPRKDFPYGVLIVNVIGSFAIGAITVWCYRRGVSGPILATLTTGFLGGFTTYSAFNYDLTMFIAEGSIGKSIVYALATVAGCLVAGFLGLLVFR